MICFNPLPLIFIPFMVRRIRRGRISLFIIAEFAVCTAFLIMYPLIPQRAVADPGATCRGAGGDGRSGI